MDLPPEPRPLGKLTQDLVASFRGLPGDSLARSRLRRTKTAAELMASLQIKHGLGRSTPEQALREEWAEIVGAANASYSHAVRLDGHTLLVHASHPVVREELFLHRAEILERIQKKVGADVVWKVRFATA